MMSLDSCAWQSYRSVFSKEMRLYPAPEAFLERELNPPLNSLVAGVARANRGLKKEETNEEGDSRQKKMSGAK